MNTDLIAVALVQLASIMAATWPLTEQIGGRLRRVPKFWIAQLVAAALSTAAYALGWFSALPTVAAGGVPVAGVRAYLSAAFAGFVGAALASGGHALLVGSRSAAAPPAGPGGGTP